MKTVDSTIPNAKREYQQYKDEMKTESKKPVSFAVFKEYHSKGELEMIWPN